jgi:hypothetical protein
MMTISAAAGAGEGNDAMKKRLESLLMIDTGGRGS